ncbi:MAG: hypothetical protein B6U69_00200 [Thermofilum sp. ex4484_15]|nr:MAG: hypothetical protein B6U69_00200 [Thermofilum sp. ex4484_15]
MEEEYSRFLDAFTKMKKEVDRIFSETVSKLPRGMISWGLYEPPYDLEDAGNEYILRIDVPGFRKEEIKIRVTEDSVEVKAEYSKEKKEEDSRRNYVVKQRVYEGFHKVVNLPSKIKPNEAKAVLTNGVLEIHLPKSETSREVEIQIES